MYRFSESLVHCYYSLVTEDTYMQNNIVKETKGYNTHYADCESSISRLEPFSKFIPNWVFGVPLHTSKIGPQKLHNSKILDQKQPD